MYLLSVQGRYAPAFLLDDEMAIKLKHQIEAVTNKQVLIISSKFRSDLVYQDESNRLEEFLLAWCKLAGYPYSDNLKLKFFRSDDEIISTDYFFYRLQLIKRIPTWYNGYLEKLKIKINEDPQNPLCQKLSKGMKIFFETMEKQKLKMEREAMQKKVNTFINLRNLSSLNKGNCN